MDKRCKTEIITAHKALVFLLFDSPLSHLSSLSSLSYFSSLLYPLPSSTTGQSSWVVIMLLSSHVDVKNLSGLFASSSAGVLGCAVGPVVWECCKAPTRVCGYGDDSSSRSINPSAPLLGAAASVQEWYYLQQTFCDSSVSCVLFQIFSGLLVNLPSVMGWLNWLKYFSIPRYGLTVSRKQHWSPLSNVATLLLPGKVLSIKFEILLKARFGLFHCMNLVKKNKINQSASKRKRSLQLCVRAGSLRD